MRQATLTSQGECPAPGPCTDHVILGGGMGPTPPQSQPDEQHLLHQSWQSSVPDLQPASSSCCRYSQPRVRGRPRQRQALVHLPSHTRLHIGPWMSPECPHRQSFPGLFALPETPPSPFFLCLVEPYSLLKDRSPITTSPPLVPLSRPEAVPQWGLMACCTTSFIRADIPPRSAVPGRDC